MVFSEYQTNYSRNYEALYIFNTLVGGDEDEISC